MSRHNSDSPPAYEDIFPFGKRDNKTEVLVGFQEKNCVTCFTRHGQWPEGEGTYKGELDWKGRRSGQGRIEWTEDERSYEGKWVKDMMEGEGILWWGKTGSYYAGQWKRGAMHGKGIMVWGDKSEDPGGVYKGEFR